jgi:hypothetical protein
MRHKTSWIRFWSLAVLLVSSGALAIEVRTGTEDFTLNVDGNLQFRNENIYDGPPPTVTSGPAPSGHVNTDFFMRRASVSARGTAYKIFWYYVKLETGKFGARGNYSSPELLQDVVVGLVPVPDVYIEGGFLKTPLSRPAIDSSWRDNSLEGVSDILMYPDARSQRQTGVQLRALLLDKRILIRGGAYEGARATTAVSSSNPAPATNSQNPDGVPLLAGMARLNLIGSDDGYTYPQIYIDGSSHLSVGVGGQFQPHSGSPQNATTVYDYSALAADAFVDMAVPGDMEALFIIDGYRFDWGPGQAKTGWGLHSEAGYRFGPIQPQANFYWFNSDTRKNSFLKVAGGLNYYIRGHHAKIQAEYESLIVNGVLPNTPGLPATPRQHQILFQAQVAF